MPYLTAKVVLSAVVVHSICIALALVLRLAKGSIGQAIVRVGRRAVTITNYSVLAEGCKAVLSLAETLSGRQTQLKERTGCWSCTCGRDKPIF